MPETNETTKKTLQERTQSFRNKATRILKMRIVNDLLAMLFQTNRQIADIKISVETTEKEIADANKIVARAAYKLIKLDEEDPDFTEKRDIANKFVESETKRQKETLEYLESDLKQEKKFLENTEKELVKINEEITKVENGETKVSIDKVNALASDLIAKS